MGMRLFSDSRSYARHPTDPDPAKFRVDTSFTHNGYTVAEVTYPNCTTFGGKKILVISEEYSTEALIALEKLDPHFIEGQEPLVVARFSPDDVGKNLLAYLIEALPR